MTLATIHLFDLWQPLVDAWEQTFEPYEEVHVAASDFFALDADAQL